MEYISVLFVQTNFSWGLFLLQLNESWQIDKVSVSIMSLYIWVPKPYLHEDESCQFENCYILMEEVEMKGQLPGVHYIGESTKNLYIDTQMLQTQTTVRVTAT